MIAVGVKQQTAFPKGITKLSRAASTTVLRVPQSPCFGRWSDGGSESEKEKEKKDPSSKQAMPTNANNKLTRTTGGLGLIGICMQSEMCARARRRLQWTRRVRSMHVHLHSPARDIRTYM